MCCILAGAAAAAPIPHDTVVMAKQIDDIDSLDPAEAYELSGEELLGNLYDRLVDYDPSDVTRIVGGLAQAWSADEDGRVYTFKLRPGLRFSSGNPVTARDAAFSLQRAVILGGTPSFILGQFGFTRDNVRARIRAETDDTLVLETAAPVAPSLLYDCLTATVASIIDEQVVMAHARNGDLGHDWLARHAAGSGPYHLKAWRPGERYALDANAQYWGGAPRNSHVVVINIKEPTTQRLLLEQGDVDYARNLDKDQLDALAANPEIAFDRGVQTTLTYLSLNQKNPDLRRPEVIEAIKDLVAYDGIARNVLGGARIVHQNLVPHGLLGALDDEPYRFDPAQARSLLAAAGLGGGFTLRLDVRNGAPWIDIAQALQAGFAQAGIRLEIVPGDGKATLTRYRARRHDLFLGDWTPDYPDPDSNAEAFTANDDNGDGAAAKTLAWRNAWQDPALAALARQARQEHDTARRAELYRQIERAHRGVAPFVFMFQQVEVAAHRRSVAGLVIGASPDHTRYAAIEKH